MSNRQIANKFAEAIKDTYKFNDVKVCYNLSQAKKYGMLTWRPDTVAFACIYRTDDGEITAVVPIAKRVLFQKIDGKVVDNTTSLLATVGRFVMNHFELEMKAIEIRAVNEVLHG